MCIKNCTKKCSISNNVKTIQYLVFIVIALKMRFILFNLFFSSEREKKGSGKNWIRILINAVKINDSDVTEQFFFHNLFSMDLNLEYACFDSEFNAQFVLTVLEFFFRKDSSMKRLKKWIEWKFHCRKIEMNTME